MNYEKVDKVCYVCKGVGTYVGNDYDRPIFDKPIDLFKNPRKVGTPGWYRRRLIVAMRADGASWDEIKRTFGISLWKVRKLFDSWRYPCERIHSES